MADPASERASPRPDQLVTLALDRAYLAFSGHRVGPKMTTRRDDISSSDVEALCGPVRTTSAEAVDRWLPHALTTWGTEGDLRALLPRVLELLALGQLRTPPETVLGKVRRAAAGSWSVEEQAAVDDVLSALWVATLSTWPPRAALPAWRLLVAVAEMGVELSAFLDDWMLVLGTSPGDESPGRRHLRALDAKVAGVEARGGSIAELFWTHNPLEASRLETWLRSPLTRARL